VKTLLPILALIAAPVLAQERPASLHRLLPPAGVAQLVLPDRLDPDGLDPPLVILLPDALGADGREEPYRDSLAARGIATLLLGLGEDREVPVSEIEPAATPEAATEALDWARGQGFGAIGLLGFGLGGRAALAAGRAEPVAALYPRCRGLPAPPGSALVIQGGTDRLGCEALPSGVELHLLPDVGHAWDAPGAMWPSPGPVLPDPAGGARLRARADHLATLAAAEVAAAWFAAHLAPARSTPAGFRIGMEAPR